MSTKYENKPEHLNYTIEELRTFLEGTKVSRHMYAKMTYLMENIRNQLHFLSDIYPEITDKLMISFIRNGYTCIEDLSCPVCSISYLSVSAKSEFNSTCSDKCKNELNRSLISNGHKTRSAEDIQKSNAKRESTNKITYGHRHVAQVIAFQKKMKDTQKMRYGDLYTRTDEYRSIVKTNNEKRSIEEKKIIQKKREITNKKVRGVSNPSQCVIVKQKKKETCLMNHGTENPMHDPDIAKKALANAKKSLKANKNVDNPILAEGALQKREKTYIKNWGETHPQKTEVMKECNRQHQYNNMTDLQKTSYHILRDLDRLAAEFEEIGADGISEKYHIAYQTVYKKLGDLGFEFKGNTKISKGELEVVNFIKELFEDTDITCSSRSLLGNKKEIDIFINSLKIGIEYNGIYWHSSKILEDDYHINKHNVAQSRGMRLIQIFEDEWKWKKDIVKSKIRAILGKSDDAKVYARKTKVRRLGNADVKDFMEQHHIQGHNSASFVYGLFEEEELVAVMMFKRARGNGIELTRYATSKSVVGGFSKLLNHFLTNHTEFDTVISFADKRWSDGNLYLKNGFTHEYDTKPSYSYVVGKHRLHKSGFRRERLAKKFKNFDPSMTERENTHKNKVYRIYDCGLMKFSLANPYFKEREVSHD